MSKGISSKFFYSKKKPDLHICFPKNAQLSDGGSSESDEESWRHKLVHSNKIIPETDSEDSGEEPPKQFTRRKKMTKAFITDRFKSKEMKRPVDVETLSDTDLIDVYITSPSISPVSSILNESPDLFDDFDTEPALSRDGPPARRNVFNSLAVDDSVLATELPPSPTAEKPVIKKNNVINSVVDRSSVCCDKKGSKKKEDKQDLHSNNIDDIHDNISHVLPCRSGILCQV